MAGHAIQWSFVPSTDETFMLVRSSRVFSHLESTASQWQHSVVQMVVSSQRSVVLFTLLFLIVVPLLVVVTCFYLTRNFGKKEATPQARAQRDAPSCTPSMRWLEVRSKASRLSQGSEQRSTPEPFPPPYLCSELVVPAGKDCEFALPNLQAPSVEEFFKDARECVSLPQDILDRTGRPLLRLALTRIAGKSLSSFFEYVLLAKPDATELASCELDMNSDDGPRRSQCSIYVKTGEFFARVEEMECVGGERSFTISGVHPKNPWHLRVRGDFKTHQVTVVSVETGRKVASTTDWPTNTNHYLVRLASSSDAALVIIALVVIDRMVALVQHSTFSTSTSVEPKTKPN